MQIIKINTLLKLVILVAAGGYYGIIISVVCSSSVF